MLLSIVVPAHNEEDNIEDAIKKIEASLDGVDFELIVVDDHSVDNTVGLVQGVVKSYANLRLISNDQAPSFANALKSGFKAARADVVLPVMADLCDDLGTIRKMLAKIEEGYDIVCGCRYSEGGARIGGSKIKGFFSCFVGKSLQYLLGLPTSDIANAFKMYKREVLESMEISARSFEISMEIPLKAYYNGFKITEVVTVWKERVKGRSSFKMLRLFPNYFKLYFWAITRNLFSKKPCQYYQL